MAAIDWSRNPDEEPLGGNAVWNTPRNEWMYFNPDTNDTMPYATYASQMNERYGPDWATGAGGSGGGGGNGGGGGGGGYTPQRNLADYGWDSIPDMSMPTTDAGWEALNGGSWVNPDVVRYIDQNFDSWIDKLMASAPGATREMAWDQARDYARGLQYSGDSTVDPADYWAGVVGKLQGRVSNEPGGGGGEGGGGGRGGGFNGLNVSGIFDDPLLQQFTDVAQGNLNNLMNPLPDTQFNQLMEFLNSQFADLSQNPGYSPQELSLLNTQMFEPIEAQRTASQRRALERVGEAGYLPTSGVAQILQNDMDRFYDQQRTAANRDLGVQAIGERNADLARALGMAQQGYQTPINFQGNQDARQAQAMSVAKLLADTPLEQAAFAQSLINGTPLGAGLNSYAQWQNLALQQQQLQDARNSQFWGTIGSVLDTFFGGGR